jgi:integrase
MNITSLAVSRLENPLKGQRLYLDDNLRGFGVLVSVKAKSYIIQRDIKGRTRRITIGRHGILTADQAKKEAIKLLAQMTGGQDPVIIKQEEKANSLTLKGAADLYLNSQKMKDERSPKTLLGYNQNLNCYFKDWLKKPLKEITREAIRERHLKIGENNGHYAANSAMRTFRAIWNRAMRQNESLPACPTINVDWYPEHKREAIPQGNLSKWYEGIQSLSNPIRHDAYLFLLFTGLRAESAATIKWEDVNFENESLFIPIPKGGKKRAFYLPLSEYVINLLKRRKEENELVFPGSQWVFPSNSKKKVGRIAEWKLSVREKKNLSLPFTPHQLRHNYISIAHSIEISEYNIKLLVNHSLPKSDVTAGYISPDVEALRESQQQITNKILSILNLPKVPISSSSKDFEKKLLNKR